MQLEGSLCIVEIVFTGKRLHWGSEKIKPYCGDEEWLVELLDDKLPLDPVDEQLPLAKDGLKKFNVEYCA